MRRLYKISLVVLTLVLACGCRHLRTQNIEDEVIASVDAALLRRSELAAAMPNGVAADDSVAFSKRYISKWIVEQLKQRKAEELFSGSEADIERMVEEYRRSLLVHRLDRHYLEMEPCNEISDFDMRAYYNDNKSAFRLTSPLVKGEIVAIRDDFRRREQLVRWFESTNREHRADFEEVCRKNNFAHLKFESWTPFADFLSNLPLLRTSRHESLLGKRDLQTIHYDRVYYYFRITNVLKEGDVTPFEMVKDNIQQILINRHQAEVVRRQEEQLMNRALESGYAKIYDQTEN